MTVCLSVCLSRLTAWSRVLLRHYSHSASRKNPRPLWKPKVPEARHWPLSWARWIQSTPPHPISPRSILIRIILTTTPRSSEWSLQVFRPQLCVFIISPMRATCHANLIAFDFISLVSIEAYKLWSSSLSSFPQLPSSSSLLGPNIHRQNAV
jgi:hypothetical protein